MKRKKIKPPTTKEFIHITTVEEYIKTNGTVCITADTFTPNCIDEKQRPKLTNGKNQIVGGEGGVTYTWSNKTMEKNHCKQTLKMCYQQKGYTDPYTITVEVTTKKNEILII